MNNEEFLRGRSIREAIISEEQKYEEASTFIGGFDISKLVEDLNEQEAKTNSQNQTKTASFFMQQRLGR